MNTKLTLRLDDALILGAKRYSAKSGKSVSRLVSDYFALIARGGAEGDEAKALDLTPRVRSLFGALSGCSGDEADYRRYLEEKHR